MDNINNLYIPVRERIFALLASKSISQRDFAQTIDVNPQTLTDWKKGKSFSFMKKLTAIAEALGTSEIWLLTGKHTAQNPNTVTKLETIADAEHVHLLDLIGIGETLDHYLIDVESVSRKDGQEFTPEDGSALRDVLTANARQLYSALDREGKEKFFGILETDTLCQNIERYCRLRGVDPAVACKECGVGETFFRDIGQGMAPSVIKVQALAQYLGVTTSELLGEEKSTPNDGEKATIDVVDDDLREYLDELRTRPETRLLFSVTKNATKSQIEAIVKMVEEMQGKK